MEEISKAPPPHPHPVGRWWGFPHLSCHTVRYQIRSWKWSELFGKRRKVGREETTQFRISPPTPHRIGAILAPGPTGAWKRLLCPRRTHLSDGDSLGTTPLPITRGSVAQVPPRVSKLKVSVSPSPLPPPPGTPSSPPNPRGKGRHEFLPWHRGKPGAELSRVV